MTKFFRFYCIALLLISFGKAKAQFYFYNEDFYDNPILFEAGGSIGMMNCLTNLGGHKGQGQKFLKDVNFGQSHLNKSLYFGMLFNYSYGIRIEASLGQVSAADSVLKNSGSDLLTNTRYDRNLSFKSNISELSIISEFFPTFIFRNRNTLEIAPKASPYFLIGIGIYHFNPKTWYKGEWIELQPLHLEGQGFKEYPDRPNYKLTQINFPLGAGVKYEINYRLNLRAEFLYRMLNTDYLDDVSRPYIDPSIFKNYLSGKQLEEALALNYRGYEINKDHDHNEGAPRGGSYKTKKNDAYFTFNFKIGWVFGRTKIRF